MRAQAAESLLPDTLALAVAIHGISRVEAFARALPDPGQDIVVVVVEILLADVGCGLGELVFGQLAEIDERGVS